MLTSSRLARFPLVGLGAMAWCAIAQVQQTFTPKTIVQWGPGGDRERAMLTQMGVGQLVQGQFGLSAADLNGDGKREIIVLSLAACDNAGCPITALQIAGPGQVQQIFSQKLGGRLAITNEQINGYDAFAAADQSGAIMKDGSGRLLVYPVGANASAVAAAPPTPAPAPAPAPAAPAARPPQAAAAPAGAPATAAPVDPNSRRARATGEGQPPWQTPGAEYIPVCLYPRCLNPQIVERSGIGTEHALIRGAVSEEDATRWCATYMKLDRLCPQTEVANIGTAGGATGRPLTTTAEANCAAGTMRGIDNRNYTYAGTWADGTGAGRPKFTGGTYHAQKWEQDGAGAMESGQQSIYMVAREGSSGEALAIQWEILCAGAPPPAR